MKKSLQIADKRRAARRRRFQREHLARRHAWDACRHMPGHLPAHAQRKTEIGWPSVFYWARAAAAVAGMVYFDEVADVPSRDWREP